MQSPDSDAFARAYRSLNPEQKQAVDTIDGPVLVIAGPGSGKTQLLSTRVGHILNTADVLPENILCLTFSDAGVAAMKQRLANLIGPSAPDVTVSTYHAFGVQLFDKYPELFLERADDEPADELIIDRTVRQVQAGLPYANRLKSEYFIGDIKELISAYKRAMITPQILKSICDSNDAFAKAATPIVNTALASVPRISLKCLPAFAGLLEQSDGLPQNRVGEILPLKALWLESLSAAVDTAQSTNKPAALTQWKDRWLSRAADGTWQVLDPRALARQHDFVEVFVRYSAALKKAGRYDYDDMIALAISGLKANPDIKLSLQERYQYLQLDEFQDTNRAQLELVELLMDNPVNENRPNVLAVGDDDQAIYSFQGAHYSNMEHFFNNYAKVKLVALKANYRSTPGIIELAGKVRQQITGGLTLAPKDQVSAAPKTPADIRRVSLPLDVEALAWTAQSIAALVKDGNAPESIAVLAPKHELLLELVPYLHAQDIAISYEQRDNVLDDPIVNKLLSAAKLVLAIDHPGAADSLWPIVLSHNYWGLPTTLLWKLSWRAREDRSSWTDLLLEHDATRPIAWFFIRLNQIADYTAFEQMLNYLIGSLPLTLNQPGRASFSSPFFNYYLSDLAGTKTSVNPDSWRLLGHLSVLRANAKASSAQGLTLAQFVEFCTGYQDAALAIVDRSPFRESQAAVNLMTAYSAKGREFESVILIDLVDSVWGRTSRGRSHKLALAPNLSFVRLARSDDEKLRLLFVALSRAKRRLLLCGYTEAIDGRKAEPVGFLAEHVEDGKLISPLLPKASQTIISPPVNTKILNRTSLVWFDRHLDHFESERRALLQPRLDIFSLSSTSLNAFTDVAGGGPRRFFIDQILKFPQPQSLMATYGSVIHHALDWQFKQARINSGRVPKLDLVLVEFERELSRRQLSAEDLAQLTDRGREALRAYFKQTALTTGAFDQSEVGFAATVGNARLVGEIDRLLIDSNRRTLTIIDFKTGRSYERWGNEVRPFHHQRQLYFYKLLVEHAPQFKGYSVESARLQFVEPDSDDGKIKQIELKFDPDEADLLNRLIAAVWDRIMQLDFPDTSSYNPDLKGILRFEQLLLDQQK